jgi:quercetin dioxygenase-like cupin family protein
MTDLSASILATGTLRDAELVCAEVTLAPGASTGWHYHDGPLLAAVRAGTLTQFDAAGLTTVRRAGECFVEPAGPDHLHVGHNLGLEPVELLVTYVVPPGCPLRVDVDPPEALDALLLLLQL